MNTAKVDFNNVVRAKGEIYAQELKAGVNPVDKDAERKKLNDTIKEAGLKHQRAVERNLIEKNAKEQQFSGEKTIALSAADAWYGEQYPLVFQKPEYVMYYSIHYTYPPELFQDLKNLAEEVAQRKADAELDHAVKVANATKVMSDKNAESAFQKQGTINDAVLAYELKEAEHYEWIEVRQINAVQKYEAAVATAAKDRDVTLAEKYLKRVEDLAQLAKDYDIDLEEAAAKRTTDKAEAAQDPIEARAADDPTPWWTEQKELVTHSVTYVTNLVAKVVIQFTGDAESVRDEIATIAKKQETLTRETAELRLVQKVNDSVSWQTFRLAASAHQRTYLDHEAGLHFTMQGTRNSADKAYADSFALATQTRSLAVAESAQTQSYDVAWAIAHTTSESSKNYFLALAAKDFAYRNAEIQLAYSNGTLVGGVSIGGVVNAEETRGLARTTAQQDYELMLHLRQKERESADIDSYKDYDKEVADHALEFATGFAGKYATYLTAVSAKVKETAEEENQSQKTLEDGEAQLDKTRQDDDAGSVKDFLSAAAGLYQTVLEGWNTVVNTAWTRLNARNAQAEVTRADDQGTSLVGYVVGYVAGVGGVTLGYLTGLSGIAQALGDGIAGALHTENSTLAEGVKQYATGVATKRQEFAHALVVDTAEHDNDVAGRNKVYQDHQTFRQKTRDDGVNAAQWGYERLVADEVKSFTETTAGINYSEATGTITSEAATTQRVAAAAAKDGMVASYEAARKSNVADAEAVRVNGNAADHKSWIADVGQMNVEFAAGVKEAIDGLASGLKEKEDKLTTDQATAAKGLATELANHEKTSRVDSSTAGANLGNSLAPIHGTDSISRTTRENTDRQSRVHNRGTHETEIRQEHSTKMQAATAPAGAMQNLQGFQRSAAIHDAAWSMSKGLAVDVAQLAYSAAYLAQTVGMGGVGGANIVLAAAQGATDVAAVTGEAAADAAYGTKVANSATDYAASLATAATKRVKDGTVAVSKYNLEWNKANKKYNDDVAAAAVIWTGRYVEIEIAMYLGNDIPYVPTTFTEEDREARKLAAEGAIEKEFTATEKMTRATFAGKVGDALVVRAGELGNGFVNQATDTGVAEIALAEGLGTGHEAYEGAITAKENALAVGETVSSSVYSNRIAILDRDLTVALGAAEVQRAQGLGLALVAKVGAFATGESAFWLAERAITSDRYVAWATTQNTASASFLSARAVAQSEWIADMSPAYVTLSTAMAQADANRDMSLATGVAAKDNADKNSNVIYVSTTMPLYSTAIVATVQAERARIEQDTVSANQQSVSESTAQTLYDIAIATAARTQAISSATAEKTLQVGLFNLAEGGSSAPLLKAYDVALADAELARVGASGAASVTWTTSIAAADKLWVKAVADHERNYLVEFARIVKDLATSIAPRDEALSVAQTAAQTAAETAITNATNAHRTAQYVATADYQQAELAATASALTTLAASVGLPWTDYQEDLAAAKLDWFVISGRSQYLELGAELNSTHATYQTAHNSSVTSRANGVALAQKNDSIAQANAYYVQAVSDADSAKLYRDALADAGEPWQFARAGIGSSADIGNQTARRDYVDNGNAEAFNAALAAVAASSLSARKLAAHDFTWSEAVAWGERWRGAAEQERDGVVARTEAATEDANALAALDYLFAVSEAAAARTRGVSLATAETNFHVAASDTWADGADALAQENPSPWANHDDAVAAAEAQQDGVTRPAKMARDTAFLDSISVLAEASARATRDRALAIVVSELARATAQSQSLVARATDEAASKLALASVQNLPDGTAEPALSSQFLASAGTNSGTEIKRPTSLPQLKTPSSQFAVSLSKSSLGTKDWTPRLISPENTGPTVHYVSWWWSYPGGHHFIPRAVAEALLTVSEFDAWKIFSEATLDSQFYVHGNDIWKGITHPEYNAAVKKLLEAYRAGRPGGIIDIDDARKFLNFIRGGASGEFAGLEKMADEIRIVKTWMQGYWESIEAAQWLRLWDVNNTLKPDKVKEIIREVVNDGKKLDQVADAAKLMGEWKLLPEAVRKAQWLKYGGRILTVIGVLLVLQSGAQGATGTGSIANRLTEEDIQARIFAQIGYDLFFGKEVDAYVFPAIKNFVGGGAHFLGVPDKPATRMRRGQYNFDPSRSIFDSF